MDLTTVKSKDIKQPTVVKVDLLSKFNNTNHHTDEIRVDRLIVRRGQPFFITVDLDRPFNGAKDTLIFIAETGSHPEDKRGTRTVFSAPNVTVPPEDAIAVWKAEVERGDSLWKSITLKVYPPANAPTGKWKFRQYKQTKPWEYNKEKDPEESLIILFNPWCEEDWVYMKEDDRRKEYVMNENGIIYRGSYFNIHGLNWDFGQFEEEVLDICLTLLDLNPKHQKDAADDVSARCNPLYVGRVISAMVNSNLDRGILQGNWSGNYRGGVCPTHWDGSVDILQQWHDSEYKPVKYGQCWVFAGVMCTVMRCLGIPCRVVTNFSSAHDTDMSLTIDKYYDIEGFELDSNDSIWNFHVWTEGWMKRPDISVVGEYDGWQALDPTPQELSEGSFCCGPASVKAIFKGDTHRKYDVPFVFAEVNADVIHYVKTPSGACFKASTEKAEVGKKTSTKAVGSRGREDITYTYKHREGTRAERAAFKRAVAKQLEMEKRAKENEGGILIMGRVCGPQPVEPTPEETTPDEPPPEETTPTPYKELLMNFNEDIEPVNGQDICMEMKVSSEDQEARTFSTHINVQVMTYTGKSVAKIQHEKRELVLKPGTELFVPITIPFKTYGKPLQEGNSLKVSVTATDKQNPMLIYHVDTDVCPKDPTISMTVVGEPKLYYPVKVEVVFQNPIDETLKESTLVMTGSGLLRRHETISLPDLGCNQRYRITYQFTPYKKGVRTLSADLDCSVFRDIKCSCDIEIK